jgi:hypothetical protein
MLAEELLLLLLLAAATRQGHNSAYRGRIAGHVCQDCSDAYHFATWRVPCRLAARWHPAARFSHAGHIASAPLPPQLVSPSLGISPRHPQLLAFLFSSWLLNSLLLATKLIPPAVTSSGAANLKRFSFVIVVAATVATARGGASFSVAHC